jgi:nucleoid-associated protein YgaU
MPLTLSRAVLLTVFSAFSLVASAQTPAPSAPATPPPAAASAPAVEPQDTIEAKMAIVLRSYTLLRDENDQLKAEKEKWAAERASLEAQLGVAKGAIPLADQAAGMREQLRQAQDQIAALSLENNQLKTRLALAGPAPGALPAPGSAVHPTEVATTPLPAPTVKNEKEPEAPVVSPSGRTHVVVAGDTLMKISKQYYGTATRWTEIFVANPDVLKDEKSLIIGKTLRIP